MILCLHYEINVCQRKYKKNTTVEGLRKMVAHLFVSFMLLFIFFYKHILCADITLINSLPFSSLISLILLLTLFYKQ